MPVKEFANKCRECGARYGKRIKELEQTIDMQDREADAVLKKIRDEIEALPKTYPFVDHVDPYIKTRECMQIIDKYRQKVEVKEGRKEEV